MLPKINPTSTNTWKELQEHFTEVKNTHIRDLFSKDDERFKKYSMCLSDIVFDYSKNIIIDKTVQLLLQLAKECKLKDAIASMYNGDMINETEKRSVLHIALRNFSDEPVYTEGKDVMPEIKKVLRKMKNEIIFQCSAYG